MFHDDDMEVRKAAARSLRAVASLPPGVSDSLIDSFLSGPASAEHPDILAASLSRSTMRLPSRALEASHALAAVAERGSDERRHGYALIQSHLTETVLRLYRQGNPVTRGQCLDIIDGLYRTNAHGSLRCLLRRPGTIPAAVRLVCSPTVTQHRRAPLDSWADCHEAVIAMGFDGLLAGAVRS
ncbi:hypothetical protein ACWDRR_01660 [Kitasatospora sp. NPDC003701]